ncbi:hypothetical protein ACN28C_25090 [Plantactinospora sp. WMMC1484]|uniref:hypothetical protein n=1 Tax=Plantactinospora sp. WMMC1484 TaxID=3404122 RepID=UPI003BF55D39
MSMDVDGCCLLRPRGNFMNGFRLGSCWRRLIPLTAVVAAWTVIMAPTPAAAAEEPIGTFACPSIPSTHDPNVIRIVYQVASGRGVSARVMLATFEAGWVESHMNNLPCGDADSLGVFQQRPSQGWGTPAQIMDVRYATNRFLDRAVVEDRNCAACTAGQIAQRVQRSAHPERYDQAETKARQLLAEARAGAPDEIGVYRPDNATFYLRNGATARLGSVGDVPVTGDWNRDGVDSIGVYRPDNRAFYLKNGNSSGDADGAFYFGNPGDVPVVGDWNGDGYDTIGVYRPDNRTFYLKNSNDNSGVANVVFSYGNSGDVPVVGDWDGDGVDTIGMYRPGNRTFYLKNSNSSGNADGAFVFGNDGDVPMAGNWDGDPYDTIGVYRPGNRTFYLKNRNDNAPADLAIVFGNFDDVPLSGRWR